MSEVNENKQNNIQYYTNSTEPTLTAEADYFTGRLYNANKVSELLKNIYNGENGDFLLSVNAEDNHYTVKLSKLHKTIENAKICTDKVAVRCEKASSSENEASWEINCDGYYPYCTNCAFEPDRDSVISLGLPKICPHCKCTMINAEEMNKK